MLNDYSLVSLQANLFPTIKLLTDTNKIATKLLALQHFTGETKILPISGENTPDGFPAITLKTTDGLEFCEISNEKISLTWLLKSDSDDVRIKGNMHELITKVSRAAIDSSPEFHRIGLVSTIRRSLDNPGQNSSVLQDILDSGSSRLLIPNHEGVFQFFLNSTYQLKTKVHDKCFRVFTIGTAKQEHPQNANVFAIQQDINTQPDVTNRFNLDFTKNFITEVGDLLSKKATHDFVWGE